MQRLRGISPEDYNAMQTENDDVFKNLVDGKTDTLIKGYNLADNAVTDYTGVLGRLSVAEAYRGYSRRTLRGSAVNVNDILRAYSDNPVITAIINTRVNQVTNYAQPAKNSQDGIGYRVRLRSGEKPTKEQQHTIERAERFIENMGVSYDPTRDTFPIYLRKLVRDSLIYDQVAEEKTYDDNMNLHHVKLVDPTTIMYTVDKKTGKTLRTGKIYSQVINKKVVRRFDTATMGLFIRNKSTDINAHGYGHSELESALREVFAQENTEKFNDRFFTHGGTVRGIINIKASGNTAQSRRGLDEFKRLWHSSAVGVSAAWSIPVVQAEDVKWVDLSPNAQDMQFEKWFNYLFIIIAALYCIDLAEVGMTNRGGATGSKSNSLNEGNGQDKITQSHDKGLKPLLSLISEFITKDILTRLVGKNYVLEFVGGDLQNRQQEMALLEKKLQTYQTVNEVRKQHNLPAIQGGDVPLNGAFIQRLGQIYQQQQVTFQNQQARLAQINSQFEEQSQPTSTQLPSGVSYQDMQRGMNGKPAKPSGKSNQMGSGKDGQIKNQNNTGSFGEGGKNHKK
mgnify:CR=1 FL=1